MLLATLLQEHSIGLGKVSRMPSLLVGCGKPSERDDTNNLDQKKQASRN